MSINEEIKLKEVRLVGADGEQLGVLSSHDALERAYSVGLDLVLIAPTANPPVCRIMDYGKYRYDRDKKEKEAKKRDNERYADLIKRASTPSSKASYRKSKVDAAARHDSRIESYKRQIESAKESLARLKK